MDSAKRLDDDCSRCGLLRAAFSECPAGKEYSKTRSRVGLEQEHYRFSDFIGLLDSDRGEDAVIYGVVQEHHLCRFNDQGYKWKEMMLDENHSKLAQSLCQPYHNISYEHISEDRQKHTDDTYREIIDQHLESVLDLSFDLFVKFPDAPSSERTHHHCADEHRNAASYDHTSSRYCSGDTASFTCNVLSCSVSYEDRKQIFEHRIYELAEVFIGTPACRNEESSEESPCDECSDVRHDHAAEASSELLHFLLDIYFFHIVSDSELQVIALRSYLDALGSIDV